MSSLNSLCQNINLINVVTVARFLVIFLLVTVGALFELMKYLMEFSLKLLYQLKELIRSITPIVLALIEMNTKVIYGLFVLISMCFKGNKNARLIYNRNDYIPRRITPNRHSNDRYYNAYKQSSPQPRYL